jgi:hypothetical protein
MDVERNELEYKPSIKKQFLTKLNHSYILVYCEGKYFNKRILNFTYGPISALSS